MFRHKTSKSIWQNGDYVVIITLKDSNGGCENSEKHKLITRIPNISLMMDTAKAPVIGLSALDFSYGSSASDDEEYSPGFPCAHLNPDKFHNASGQFGGTAGTDRKHTI